MNRFSLIEKVNQAAAASIALILWVALLALRGDGLAFHFDSVRAKDGFLIPMLLISAHFLSKWINKTYLPRIVNNGTYWKVLLLCGFYTYFSCYLLCLFFYFQEAHWSSDSVLSILGAAFFLPIFFLIWLFPITIPVSLIWTAITGFLFQFLYARRDYLPEEL